MHLEVFDRLEGEISQNTGVSFVFNLYFDRSARQQNCQLTEGKKQNSEIFEK